MRVDEIIKHILDVGGVPSVPMAGAMSISTPLTDDTHTDRLDKEWKKNNPHRIFNIRENYKLEFDFWPTPFTPPIFVWVIYPPDSDHIIRLIVWIGDKPFASFPETDCGVLNTLGVMCQNRGCNVEKTVEWVKEALGIV